MDDFRTHRAVVAFNLEQAGYRVTTAANVAEALKLAEKEPFDLVITDYYMPGDTGTNLIRMLRKIDHYADIPMILITAKANELNLKYLSKSLSVHVVSKPCSIARLMDMVSSCLATARGAC
ncbi:response regulator [Planctomycetota bacterium]